VYILIVLVLRVIKYLVDRRYVLRICKKCISALSDHAIKRRAYVSSLQQDLDQRLVGSHVDMAFIRKQVTRLQAYARGLIAKTAFTETKISKLYSVQVFMYPYRVSFKI